MIAAVGWAGWWRTGDEWEDGGRDAVGVKTPGGSQVNASHRSCYPDRNTLRLGGILEGTAAVNWPDKHFYQLLSSVSAPVLRIQSKTKEENPPARCVWTSCVYTGIMKIFNTQLFSKHTEHLRSKEKRKRANQLRERKKLLFMYSFINKNNLKILTIVKLFSWNLKTLFTPEGEFQGETRNKHQIIET